ncbi:hypothetical protein D9758_002783 [Tetrapyrgos nigripes]|uniref:Zinc-finger domain-containing protein n=1 Tax=Tetrapyrgos nigripes TaxID=182062 RepID=A0A8H5GRD7_9AGAR|nr:hypothetical protein D9758_002783 [Tetrapyrgos nigripes]
MSSAFVCPCLPTSQEKPAMSQRHQKHAESQEQERHDWHYNSVLDEYPLLRSRPRPVLSYDISPDLNSILTSDNNYSSLIIAPPLSSIRSTSHPSSPVYTMPSSSPVIDLKPLKLAKVSQSFVASRKICQYEIPGGGVCRDAKCEDFHLNGKGGKDAADVDDPNDEDTAAFVAAALPDGWTFAYGTTLTSRILAALEEIRLKTPRMPIEERVARALAALDIPPQSTT